MIEYIKILFNLSSGEGFAFQKLFSVCFCIIFNFFNVGIAVFSQMKFLFQNDFPAQTFFINFHYQPAKQFVVIVNGKTVMVIVIIFVQHFYFFGLNGCYGCAIGHIFLFLKLLYFLNLSFQIIERNG